MSKLLRRYTELPFVIEYLQSKELALLNPDTWDDRNDAYFIEQYAAAKKLLSTNALCLTEASETYHHWRVFSHGASGVCIEFKKDDLIFAARKVSGLTYGKVDYLKIKDLQEYPASEQDLPFLKRRAFSDEDEFRLFHESKTSSNSPFKMKVPISAVNRIILSPWLPKGTAISIRELIKSIPGCSSLKVSRSTLVDNARWKKQVEKIE